MNFHRFLRYRWRWLLAALLPVLLMVLALVLPVREWVKHLADFAEDAGFWGALILIIANGLAAVLLVPGWVFTLTIGLLYGAGWGALVAHSGSLLGATLAFLCGRYLIRSRVERRLAHNQKFDAIDRAIGRHGWKIVGLIRLSPLIPFFIQNYLYSVTCIRFWPYFFATAVCTLPGTLLYVYAGAAGRYGITGSPPQGGAAQWVLLGVGFAATLVGTFYISKVAKRALAERVTKFPSSPTPTPPD